jgi:hypothetical protein
MDYEIRFGGDPQDVTLTTSGVATAKDFRRMNEELVAHPAFQPSVRILVDHSELDARMLTAQDVQAIADNVSHLNDRLGSSHVAIVAPRAVTYVLTRMSELMADAPALTVATFADRPSAVAWLHEQRPAEGGEPSSL